MCCGFRLIIWPYLSGCSEYGYNGSPYIARIMVPYRAESQASQESRRAEVEQKHAFEFHIEQSLISDS